jgi:hypothetical protein
LYVVARDPRSAARLKGLPFVEEVFRNPAATVLRVDPARELATHVGDDPTTRASRDTTAEPGRDGRIAGIVNRDEGTSRPRAREGEGDGARETSSARVAAPREAPPGP